MGREIENSRQQCSWLQILGIIYASTGKWEFVKLGISTIPNVCFSVPFTISKRKGTLHICSLCEKENLLLLSCYWALLELQFISPLLSLSPWILGPSWIRHPWSHIFLPRDSSSTHCTASPQQGEGENVSLEAQHICTSARSETQPSVLLSSSVLTFLSWCWAQMRAISWWTCSHMAQPGSQCLAREQYSRDEGQGAGGPMRVAQADGKINNRS